MKTIFKKYFFSTKYSQVAIVPFSAEDYFKVVVDVKNYQNFLPWCMNSKILTKIDNYNFDAILTINFKLYQDSYISNVSSIQQKGFYKVYSISKENNIFNFLESNWKINEIDSKRCKIDYKVDFEFKNPLYRHVSSYFIDLVGKSMNKAFENRLEHLKNQSINSNKNLNNNNSERTNIIDIQNKPIGLDYLNKIAVYPSITPLLNNQLLELLKIFWLERKLSESEYQILLEIINKNLGLKEFIDRSFNIFIQTKEFYKDAELKLVNYLKEIVLMKKIS